MKYCPKCGSELFDEAVICTQCGCEQSMVNPTASFNMPKQSSPLSIVSVVVGAVGILLAWLIALLGYISGCLALSFALVAMKANSEDKKAKAGLVLSIVVFACSIINSVLGVLLML